MRRISSTEILSQRTWSLMKKVTSELLISVLLESGDLKMPKILQEHQVIWPLRLCAESTILLASITSLWVLWLMNACLEEDLMLENQERKLEITFYQSKYKLRKVIFQEDGPLKLLTSSTR